MDASDLEAALGLPFARETSFDALVVGLLVTVASFATPLAGVVLVGYVARLVRRGGAHATSLPEFDETWGLVREGAVLSAVLVALQLPAVGVAAAVLAAAGSSLASLAYRTGPGSLQYLGLSAFAVAGLVAAAVVALAGAYLSAAVTVALARERSVLAAVPAARSLAADPSFAPVVAAVGLVVVSGRLVGFLVGALPIAGTVLSAGASFLALVAAATLLGRGADATLAGQPADGASRDAPSPAAESA